MMPTMALYIHLPFCLTRCGYCDFATSAVPDIPFESYREALLAEFARMSPLSAGGFSTVYLGGGTPSLWPADELIRILRGVGISDSPASEVTVEVNPRDADERWFSQLLDAGVNRFSIGVQAMTDPRLQWLGRTHTVADAARTVAAARNAGCTNISVDFIYGTPAQTEVDVIAELADLIALAPQHISAYELSLSPHCALGRQSDPPQLPGGDAMAAMWLAVRRYLTEHGFQGYEVSNYCLPTFESRHNRHYWRGGLYLGLGAGAHGHVRVDSKRVRYGNTPDFRRYISHAGDAGSIGTLATTDPIGDADLARELIMLGLRTAEGIALEQLAQLAPTDYPGWCDIFAQWQGQGLVELSVGRVIPSVDAMLLADELAVACF